VVETAADNQDAVFIVKSRKKLSRLFVHLINQPQI
jgi:hypothetical protein